MDGHMSDVGHDELLGRLLMLLLLLLTRDGCDVFSRWNWSCSRGWREREREQTGKQYGNGLSLINVQDPRLQNPRETRFFPALEQEKFQVEKTSKVKR